ncbi:hypothetical protein BAE44_0018516 [Dichanthelium oligosanthes]|uniref:Uncharacterized protein n=1 Tax=Dichanthelium oligosanthes TaxID=888268 RepID=A0A1E5V5U3_9POAL|nr:hypothetical protein BAE44_0018516 [Dichanthelium oligosanthes]
MPKRRGQESQDQRRGGDLAGKRSQPARRRKHLYLVLDDWNKGFSVHKIDTDGFDSDSDSDDDRDAGVAVAGHLPEPPALRLESPGDADMSFATIGSKIFIVTDARCDQTPALVYDAETAGLAIGPAVPAQRCGLSVVVAARDMLYAFSPPACNEQHSFDVMSCVPQAGRAGPGGPSGRRHRVQRLRDHHLLCCALRRPHHLHDHVLQRSSGSPEESTYSFNTNGSVWLQLLLANYCSTVKPCSKEPFLSLCHPK